MCSIVNPNDKLYNEGGTNDVLNVLSIFVTAAGSFTIRPSVFPVILVESGIPSWRMGFARPYLVVNRILIYSGGLGLPHQQG